MTANRTPFLIVAAAALFLVAVAAAAQSPAAGPDPKKVKNPVAATPVSITAGAAAYKKYCAFCHGPAGAGNGPLAPKDSNPPNLTDAKWDHGGTDGEIFALIQNGAGGTSVMKGFKGKMPDTDMWHVVNYLRSLAPKKTS